MILLIEQMRPLDERIDAALRWLEDRKLQRISPVEREELSRIYWLLRDVKAEKEADGTR